MNPEGLLKQFKHIEADPDFIKKSRHLVLISKNQARPRFWGWGMIARTMEFGASVALVGLAMFMILGGFSSSRVLSPLQISNLDPASIRAEAQAIDIQIELANLNYKEGALGPKTSESTPSVTTKPKQEIQTTATKEEEPAAAAAATSAATSSEPQPVGIDEALDKLAE